MTRAALLAGLLTIAFPIASNATPPLPAAVPPPDTEAAPPATVPRRTSPWPQIGLGSLQVLAGYGAGIGGVLALAEAGVYPKKVGIHSDYGNVVYLGVLAPALASAAVCGTGYLSSAYRGRCSTTLAGAYAGAVLGALLGFLMAASPGPDDTAAFTNSMAALAGMALLTPIGAVAGWHLGKQEMAPSTIASALPARNPTVPALSLSW
jgi:hypothetical protein